MALIFTLSSFPSVQTSGVHWQDFLLKKTAHFIEYFILALLIHYSLKHTTRFSPVSLFFFSFTTAVLYAITDEVHQSFIPGREPRLRDIGIDTLGALAACTLQDRQTH